MADVKLFKCLPIPAGDHKDVYELQPIRMVLLHNLIIRGFNSVLYYSSQVKPGTKGFDSFIRYSAAVNAFVHHHHHNEEEMYFPFLESKVGTGSMSNNVAGHEEFRKPFAGFESLLTSVQKDPSSFNAEKYREAIHAFAAPLIEHLQEEIETLRPDTLKKHITTAELDAFEKAMEAHIQKHTSLVADAPLLFVNGDGTHGRWFPPMPPPLTWAVKNITSRFHSDLWAFGCCDKNMNVKPPFSAYEPELEKAN